MRQILLAVTGMSPQVVTETLFALVTQRGFIPDEIHVITTAHGKNRIMADLLSEPDGHFFRFCQEYELINRIRFDEDCIEVITDQQGMALPDIRTPAENECAANQILSFVHRWCSQDDTCLHVSIAGGRKSMGFYLGYALSLFARSQDSASHVLVNAPFESLTSFYFPPSKNTRLILPSDGSEVFTGDAQVMLADIPLVKLRAGLPSELKLKNGGLTYSEAVAQAQRNIPNELTLRFGQNPSDRTVYVNDEPCVLPHSVYAWYLTVAETMLKREFSDPRSDSTIKRFFEIYKSVLPNMSTKYERAWDRIYNSPIYPPSKEFSAYVQELNTKLKNKFVNAFDKRANGCLIVSYYHENSSEVLYTIGQDFNVFISCYHIK